MPACDPRPTLVTGATGLLGGNLARELVTRGTKVRVLVRGKGAPPALEGLDHEVAQGDIRDPDAVRRACRGCRHVYHAAAAVVLWTPDQASRDEVRAINVGGTANVLAGAEKEGVERVLHVSTVDAIGLAPPGEIAVEETDWPPGRLGTVYADTKLEAERLACAAKVEAVIVNPCYIIGPYDAKPTSGQLIIAVATGRAFGYPRRGGNNFVHVRDVVAGAIAALERGRPRERYILGNANLSYREFFEKVACVLGCRPPRLPVPRALGLALARGGDLVGWITGKEPAIYTGAAKLAWADHYFSPAKAVRELGLPQTPIEDAIRDAVAWFRERGML